MRRLSEKYSRPLFELERMPPGALTQEIAMLIADKVTSDAVWLAAKVSDPKDRRERNKEWARIQKSSDWLDTLIRERVELDAEKEKVRREAERAAKREALKR